MRKIKSFKMFEATTSNSLKNLDWLKSFIEESKSTKHNYTLEKKSGKEGEYLLLSDDNHEIELYDNGQDNNFFFIRIKKGDKVIQDFEKNKSDEDEISDEELASEDIMLFIAKYFQKI
jgi:hypothetical protein